MPRKDIDKLSEKGISRIFIAKNLKEAKLVEKLFFKMKIDYSIELESYIKTGFFSSSNFVGVAFYVVSKESTYCKEQLKSYGLESGIIDEENNV